MGAGLFSNRFKRAREGRERVVGGISFFSPSEKLTSGGGKKDATQPDPSAQTPRWWSHEEEGKKEFLRHLYREPAADANFHFPLMIDLVPDSFQTRGFCSLF